jgi:hypothetical protein
MLLIHLGDALQEQADRQGLNAESPLRTPLPWAARA